MVTSSSCVSAWLKLERKEEHILFVQLKQNRACQICLHFSQCTEFTPYRRFELMS
jgi:hypothetical protein